MQLFYPIQLLGGRIIHIVKVERSGEYVHCEADDEYGSRCVVQAADAHMVTVVSKITADFYAKQAASQAAESLKKQFISKQ